MDQKSFKKQGPRWNASWRGFLADFGAVLEPSWEQFGAMLTNSGYRKPSRQVCQVSQAKSVRSGQAAKAVDRFPPISLDKGGVPPTNKDVSSPGPRTPGAAGGRSHFLRLFRYLDPFLFSVVFSMPFLIDLGSILPPNLAPKIHQNR